MSARHRRVESTNNKSKDNQLYFVGGSKIDLNLNSGKPIVAWIDYDSGTKSRQRHHLAVVNKTPNPSPLLHNRSIFDSTRLSLYPNKFKREEQWGGRTAAECKRKS
ncbi:concanavalin A-like lectin protein kinase family protein [Striga asiatica]|uniref:Concanavalin A-like lectin protein kinase family protein n=1 Tax=Striga asiatica TaxID=4170 RepID=A0A5A7RHR5_STRAF|nr:concanavalin A-like lectin protein kinase family protein [Striga asiatica]